VLLKAVIMKNRSPGGTAGGIFTGHTGAICICVNLLVRERGSPSAIEKGGKRRGDPVDGSGKGWGIGGVREWVIFGKGEMRGAKVNLKVEFVLSDARQPRDVVRRASLFDTRSEAGPTSGTSRGFVSKCPHQMNNGGRVLDLRGEEEIGDCEKCMLGGTDSAVEGVIDSEGNGFIPFC
jgi:hypothetical protein